MRLIVFARFVQKLMNQVDQDWQAVKNELATLKAQNADLTAQVNDLTAKVPSEQTVSELHAEALASVPADVPAPAVSLPL